MSDLPQRPSNRRRIGIGLVLVGVLVLAGLSLAMLPRTKATLLDQPVTKVVRGPMTISVVESGTIRPREQLILKNELVPVRPTPRRAFQGWRYLDPAEAPEDLEGRSAAGIGAMPPRLRRQLAELGLI